MVKWKLVYTNQAKKDAKKLSAHNLQQKAQNILDLISVDPFATYPPYEKLIGDLAKAYSRRINIQHRIVYQVDKQEKMVKIIRMWTHYEQVSFPQYAIEILHIFRINRN